MLLKSMKLELATWTNEEYQTNHTKLNKLIKKAKSPNEKQILKDKMNLLEDTMKFKNIKIPANERVEDFDPEEAEDRYRRYAQVVEHFQNKDPELSMEMLKRQNNLFNTLKVKGINLEAVGLDSVKPMNEEEDDDDDELNIPKYDVESWMLEDPLYLFEPSKLFLIQKTLKKQISERYKGEGDFTEQMARACKNDSQCQRLDKLEQIIRERRLVRNHAKEVAYNECVHYLLPCKTTGGPLKLCGKKERRCLLPTEDGYKETKEQIEKDLAKIEIKNKDNLHAKMIINLLNALESVISNGNLKERLYEGASELINWDKNETIYYLDDENKKKTLKKINEVVTFLKKDQKIIRPHDLKSFFSNMSLKKDNDSLNLANEKVTSLCNFIYHQISTMQSSYLFQVEYKDEVVVQGDPIFNEAFFDSIKQWAKESDQSDVDENALKNKLNLECKKGNFAYQQIPKLLLHPTGPCSRMLICHRTGAGKTKTIVNILNNFYSDERPKICVFPNKNVRNNMIEDLLGEEEEGNLYRNFLISVTHAMYSIFIKEITKKDDDNEKILSKIEKRRHLEKHPDKWSEFMNEKEATAYPFNDHINLSASEKKINELKTNISTFLKKNPNLAIGILTFEEKLQIPLTKISGYGRSSKSKEHLTIDNLYMNQGKIFNHEVKQIQLTSKIPSSAFALLILEGEKDDTVWNVNWYHQDKKTTNIGKIARMPFYYESKTENSEPLDIDDLGFSVMAEDNLPSIGKWTTKNKSLINKNDIYNAYRRKELQDASIAKKFSATNAGDDKRFKNISKTELYMNRAAEKIYIWDEAHHAISMPTDIKSKQGEMNYKGFLNCLQNTPAASMDIRQISSNDATKNKDWVRSRNDRLKKLTEMGIQSKGTVLVMLTATPYSSLEDTQIENGNLKGSTKTLLDILKGHRYRSSQNSAGFISFWNRLPKQIYPRVEPSENDFYIIKCTLNKHKSILEMLKNYKIPNRKKQLYTTKFGAGEEGRDLKYFGRSASEAYFIQHMKYGFLAYKELFKEDILPKQNKITQTTTKKDTMKKAETTDDETEQKESQKNIHMLMAALNLPYRSKIGAWGPNKVRECSIAGLGMDDVNMRYFEEERCFSLLGDYGHAFFRMLEEYRKNSKIQEEHDLLKMFFPKFMAISETILEREKIGKTLVLFNGEAGIEEFAEILISCLHIKESLKKNKSEKFNRYIYTTAIEQNNTVAYLIKSRETGLTFQLPTKKNAEKEMTYEGTIAEKKKKYDLRSDKDFKDHKLKEENKNIDLLKTPLEDFNKSEDKIKVLIADAKTYKEGISFFGIKTIILGSPAIGYANHKQLVGRALRACTSHINYFNKEEDRVLRIYVCMGFYEADDKEGIVPLKWDKRNTRPLEDLTIDQLLMLRICRELHKERNLMSHLENLSVDKKVYDVIAGKEETEKATGCSALDYDNIQATFQDG